MIYVSNELKQAFLSAEQKNLVITFDDGTVIDNDDIAMESMDLEQTLCDSDELKFGKVATETCYGVIECFPIYHYCIFTIRLR